MCVKSSVGCDFCKVLDIYKEAYQGQGIYYVNKKFIDNGSITLAKIFIFSLLTKATS
jgi:hypothetical protein